MKLIDLNTEGGIGANSLFFQIGSFNILVDAGLHPKKAGLEAVPDFGRLRDLKLDFVILTHCHLDHLGSLPLVVREHPETQVLMSVPSLTLAERMLRNSCNVMKRQRDELNLPELPLFTHREIDRIVPQFFPMTYNRTSTFDKEGEELSITFFQAGHIAGAGGVEIVHNGKKLFLTGDVLFTPQKILPGAKFPSRHVETLVIETTRGANESIEGVTRSTEVERLLEKVRTVIERGGSCLIPVFALGRMQEVMTILHEARADGKLPKCPVFCSGLGMDLADYFDEISRKTGLIQFRRKILEELDVQPVPRNMPPGRDQRENAIYVLSSGMLVENTPSYRVASGLLGNERNAICYVGYCDPDTPGGKMLESEAGAPFIFEAFDFKTSIKADVERFELSGHADRGEILEFALAVDPKVIVLTHGDPPARAWFAENIAKMAPEIRVIDPEPLKEFVL
jgi:Cft2 family RNA processing exonuclease